MQPRCTRLGPPFLTFAGLTLHRSAASSPPCSSGTGTSKGQVQHGIEADTTEPPAHASHWACVGDICAPTLTPNLPNCWAPVIGRMETAGPPQTFAGPSEHPQNLAAPKGAGKTGLRSPELSCPEAFAVPERHHRHILLLCTEHSEQETRGQYWPLGAGFWPFFPKGNGNLSPKYDFVQETSSSCKSGVEKKLLWRPRAPSVLSILVICGPV